MALLILSSDATLIVSITACWFSREFCIFPDTWPRFFCIISFAIIGSRASLSIVSSHQPSTSPESILLCFSAAIAAWYSGLPVEEDAFGLPVDEPLKFCWYCSGVSERRADVFSYSSKDLAKASVCISAIMAGITSGSSSKFSPLGPKTLTSCELTSADSDRLLSSIPRFPTMLLACSAVKIF